MANKTEEQLLSAFSQAAGESLGNRLEARAVDRGLTDSSPAASDVSPASPFDPASESGAGESYRGDSGAVASSASGGGGGGALESLAGSVFGGALGLLPLVGTLLGLFDGKSDAQPVFQRYQMPSPISFEAADSGGGLTNADYGQTGLPRLFDSSGTDASSGGGEASAGQAAPGGANGSAAGGQAAASPQISVNVQAMDAQSFMSYSGEIAKAVRDAMLNLSSINDVVAEL